VGSVAAVVLGAGSMAWAQIDQADVISGCLSRNGFIRGVDETTNTCRQGEEPVSWYSRAGSDEAFLPKQGKAADAELLDGLDAAAFARAAHDHDGRYPTRTEADARYLAVDGTAANTDRLDGKDSTDFVQGRGTAVAGFEAVPRGTVRRHAIPGFGALDLVCFETANFEPDARFVLNLSTGLFLQFFVRQTDGALSVPANPASPSFGGRLGLVPGTYFVQATRAGGPTVTVTGTLWYDAGCNVQFLAVVAS
jgi:hypothetical protein